MFKCVKVGVKCLFSEGLTPTTSDAEKVNVLGCKTRFSVNYKNGESITQENKAKIS